MAMELVQGAVIELATRLIIGSGLLLSQNSDGIASLDFNPASAITQDQADARYVQKSGDVMTGTLTTRNVVAQAGYSIDSPSYLSNGSERLAAYTNYTVLRDSSGGYAVYLGNTNDPGNYYDNTAHTFRNRGGFTTFATISGSSLSLNVPLSINAASDVAAGVLAGYNFLKWNAGNTLHFGGFTSGQWASVSIWASGAVRVFANADGGALSGAWSVGSTLNVASTLTVIGWTFTPAGSVADLKSDHAAYAQLNFKLGSGTFVGAITNDASGFGLLRRDGNWAVYATNAGGALYGAWATGNITLTNGTIYFADTSRFLSVSGSDLVMVAGGVVRLTAHGAGGGTLYGTWAVEGILRVANSTSSWWGIDRDDTDGRFKIFTDTGIERFNITAGGGTLYGSWVHSTNNATASYNAGGGIFGVDSATATSRIAYMWLDADGANFTGSDYFYIAKEGNSGAVSILQQSNAAMHLLTNGATRVTINAGGGGTLYNDWTTTGHFKFSTNGGGIIDVDGQQRFAFYNSASPFIRAYAVNFHMTSLTTASGSVRLEDSNGALQGNFYWDTSGIGLLNNQGGWAVKCYQGAGYGGELRGSWRVTTNLDVDGTSNFDGAGVFNSSLVVWGDYYARGFLYARQGTSTDYVVATRTVSTSNPPASAAGYPVGHEWIKVTAPI